MAVTPEKIKARLKALFPKANLSKERLDAIAARLATKPADDADDAAVDEVLNNANDFMSFEDIAKEDDRVRTLEAKAKGTTPPANDPPKPEPAPDDAPAWAKQLIEKVNNIEAGKVTETKRQTAAQLFEQSETLKGLSQTVKQSWINRIDVNSETPLEDQVKGLETEYTEMFQAHANATPAAGKPPVGGGTQKADAEMIKDVVKNIVPN